ncbi:hypothetical protein AC1031_004572 [Aphanomyces cochlioides]|nr:hypothetical protein AC1031_004572 [Aphanomyces cochlioides]
MLSRGYSTTRHPFQRRVWEMLRPSNWNPATALEHSLDELKRLENSAWARLTMTPRGWDVRELMHKEEEFFNDLPHEFRDTDVKSTRQPFANYSSSCAFIVDKEGNRIESIRRRYEDSTGRLKAVHERKMPGRTLVTKWNRETPNDEGVHETTCTEGSADDFEKLWAETPFGAAAKPIELGTPQTKAEETKHKTKQQHHEQKHG